MSETAKKITTTIFEEKDRRFKETWQPRLTMLISLVALLFSVLTVVTKDLDEIKSSVVNLFGESRLIIVSLNLLISLVALIFIAKQKAPNCIIHDEEKFRSLAELGEDVNVQVYTTNLNNRVGKLVNQFRLHMTLFAFSLVLIYAIIFLGVVTSDGTRKIGYFAIITNLMNLLGALFVQLGFSVLYNKTLEAHKDRVDAHEEVSGAEADQHSLEKKRPLTYNSSLYWAIPFSCFVLYALVFISLSVSYSGGTDPAATTRFLNIFDLLAGSANGLAMSLLFGRYVSIEQAVGKTMRFKKVFENIFYPFSSIAYKTLVSVGIIFVLPVYALTQPLFGSLKIDAFGSPDHFETIVYAICLVGKICFLHLTYILISKRLLHLYLYGLVSEIGNFKELERCFDK